MVCSKRHPENQLDAQTFTSRSKFSRDLFRIGLE